MMIEHSFRFDNYLLRISEDDFKKRLRIDPLIKLANLYLVSEAWPFRTIVNILGTKMEKFPLED